MNSSRSYLKTCTILRPEEKTYVAYTFIDGDGIRQFRTYTLELFNGILANPIQHGRLALNDSYIVDNSNILDFVSNGANDFVSQLYLVNTMQSKHFSVEYKKRKRSRESHKKVCNTNTSGLPY